MPSLEIKFKEQYLQELQFKQKHCECDPNTVNFDTNANVDATKLGENVYETVVCVEINAIENNKNIFSLSIRYIGIFYIANASDEELEVLLKQECPRLLFPFIREIVAKISREAGFREIILNPTVF